MTTAQHAFLAPSGAERWGPGRCAASASMAAQYPEDEDSGKAREGTAAHWVLSETLQGRDVAVGSLAPNQHPVDQDMHENAAPVIDMALAACNAAKGPSLWVEERVTMECVHKDCWGTPDIYLLNTRDHVLDVWDYKYGHRYVDTFQNYQLMLYAMGILECNGVSVPDWRGWRITLHIAQPRSFHPEGPYRSWYLSGEALADWVPSFKQAATAATQPGAAFTTGDHCRNCPGLLHCDAALRSGMSAIDVSLLARPLELSPLGLGVLLSLLKDAEKRIKMLADAAEESVLGLLRSGSDVPLWKADYSAGRERWTQEPGEVFALGDMWGVNLRKPPEPITPAQARKLGVDKDVIAAFSDKPRGSLALVQVTERYVTKAFAAALNHEGTTP